MKKNTREKRLLLLAALVVGTGLAHAAGDGTLKGDANGDGKVDVTDAVIIIDKYHGRGEPACPLNADTNGDGVTDVTDAVAVLNIYHYGIPNLTVTISDWTEGNTSEEQEEQELICD